MSEMLRAEMFLADYAARAGMSNAQILEHRVVATCSCDYEYCEGFQVVTADGLLPWRGDRVVIGEVIRDG